VRHSGRHRTEQKFRKIRRTATGAGVAALVTAAFLVPAGATTTVSGGDPGTSPPVIRGDSTTITEDQGALFYYRAGTTASQANNAMFAAQSAGQAVTLALLGRACTGDNPAGTNNSPRDTITVTDPGGNVIASQVSPVRNVLASGAPPANPQPAPANGNYRGDFSGSGTHGMSFTLSLAGRPAGTYTVTTTQENRVKTDTLFSGGPCVIGRPDATGKGVIAGPVVSSTTFEYRPWQATFTDVLGNGKVYANVTPSEFQFSIGNDISQIYNGPMRFYTLPNSLTFMLPPNPVPCAENPASCLPSTAQPCDPSTGCVPRLMTINKLGGDERLQGIFDLTTKAFYASADLHGNQRVLFSLGTDNDGYLHGLIQKLSDAAAAQGIDLQSLLATKVRLANGDRELSLSLLNGLQIGPSSANGIQIVTDTTAQAGIIVNAYIALSPNECTSQSATSTAPPARFTPTSGVGYTVERSDILPSVPSVGALGALVGGPIYHIVGNFPNAGVLTNTSTAVIGVDTAADEPNGYPVWVEPILSSGHLTAPRTMDFLGTATWAASETSAGGLGCLVIDAMLGTGVAVYNNPLPVGFGTLLGPLFKPSPAAATFMGNVNTAVQTVVDTVSTNPAVAGLLGQLLGALPVTP
jgi:hypothetical protein